MIKQPLQDVCWMTRNSFIFNIYWKWEVDAFCGRTQKPILIRHYPDLSPERLKKNYDKANLTPILKFSEGFKGLHKEYWC